VVAARDWRDATCSREDGMTIFFGPCLFYTWLSSVERKLAVVFRACRRHVSVGVVTERRRRLKNRGSLTSKDNRLYHLYLVLRPIWFLLKGYPGRGEGGRFQRGWSGWIVKLFI
jgi:hypothetical protein